MWATGDRILGSAALVAVVASCALSATAQAAFPGHNGRIAFTSVGDDQVEIFTAERDGTGPAPLTNDPDELAAQDPAWSPDGSQIAYISRPEEGPTSVRVMGENGAGSSPVDQTSFDPREPSWSRDGRRIAWTDVLLSEESSEPRIVVDTVGGGAATPLVALGTGTVSGVAWSPDGSSIAFVWTHPQCLLLSCVLVSQLVAVDVASGAVVPLGDQAGALTTSQRGDVAWSPDGTRLAVSLAPGDLHVVSAATGARVATIVPNAAADLTSDSGSQVAWSPDGSQLVFLASISNGSNGATGLFRTSPTGTGLREVPDAFVLDASIDWQPLLAPVTAITSGPDATTRSRSARFEFVADKRPVTYQCRLDGGRWTGCASGVQYAGLPLGRHVFSVRATESHGVVEERPPQRRWEVVAPPPPPPVKRRFPDRTGIRARWYRFVFPGHMVELRSLRAVHVPRGVTIDVRCTGPGCPPGFHRRWRTHRFRPVKRILAGLRDTMLLPRAAVFVRLSKPGYIGIGKMYCVRYNRHVRVRAWDDLDPRVPKCGPRLGGSG